MKRLQTIVYNAKIDLPYFMYFLEDFHGYGADKGLKPTSTRTRTRLKSKPMLHTDVYVCV